MMSDLNGFGPFDSFLLMIFCFDLEQQLQFTLFLFCTKVKVVKT